MIYYLVYSILSYVPFSLHFVGQQKPYIYLKTQSESKGITIRLQEDKL